MKRLLFLSKMVFERVRAGSASLYKAFLSLSNQIFGCRFSKHFLAQAELLLHHCFGLKQPKTL